VGRANGETHRDHVPHCSHNIIKTTHHPSRVISMVLWEWIMGMGVVGFAVGSTHPTSLLENGDFDGFAGVIDGHGLGGFRLWLYPPYATPEA
jgi:hypothetical protein